MVHDFLFQRVEARLDVGGGQHGGLFDFVDQLMAQHGGGGSDLGIEFQLAGVGVL